MQIKNTVKYTNDKNKYAFVTCKLGKFTFLNIIPIVSVMSSYNMESVLLANHVSTL